MDIGGVPVMWEKWAAEASGPAVLAAAEAMAQSMERIAKRLVSHGGRGAPGQPPGLVTGNLRANIRALPATGGGTEAEAWCGSFAIYAAVQEYGALQWPNNHKYLHWIDDRGPTWTPTALVRPHPYMRTAVARGIASGAFTKVARAAFWAAMGG